MMEYNKKQMAPLINKYQIDVESNKLFQNIITMFEGQPNYQLWGVKVVFSKAATFEEVEAIHRWAKANKQLISNLEKHNIVSYTSRSAIQHLLREIDVLNKIALIKSSISTFNTHQRQILTDEIFGKEPLAISVINEWAKFFASLNRMPSARRQKFLSNCSALHSVDKLKQALKDTLQGTYTWDKEDMLFFMHEHAPNCTVVFEQGPYVIVRVPDFTSSKKLCGNGRTQWCITMQQEHWNSYSSSMNGYRQYFYFDFSRKETDAFAHIGFTIAKGRGIITAQTCDNQSMIEPFRQGTETQTIKTILEHCGADMSLFINIERNSNFQWSVESLIDFIKAHPEDLHVAYCDHGFIIVSVTSNTIVDSLVGNTFIPANQFYPSDEIKIYVLFNFNTEYTKSDSVYAFRYAKDKYGTLSSKQTTDALGNHDATSAYKVLAKFGLTEDMFLNQESIDPRILLHKYIDEGNENAAIELIRQNGNDFDVNYEFNGSVPLFAAVLNNMSSLFKVIVSHPRFDSAIHDGYGETIFQTLQYAYGFEEVEMTKDEEKRLAEMIEIMLDCGNVDFNTLNINEDTALSIAAESPKMLWIFKRLITRRDISVNVVNDIPCTVLSNAIRNNNMEAVRLVCMRPDLQITAIDREYASKHHVNLNDYIHPTDAIFDESAMAKEFAMATVAARH